MLGYHSDCQYNDVRYVVGVSLLSDSTIVFEGPGGLVPPTSGGGGRGLFSTFLIIFIILEFSNFGVFWVCFGGRGLEKMDLGTNSKNLLLKLRKVP